MRQTVACAVFLSLGLARPVFAQTQVTVRPDDYTIYSASTDLVAEFSLSINQPNVQVSGGDTLTIQLELPHAVGVDLISTTRLLAGVLLTGPGVPRTGLPFKFPASVVMLDPTLAEVPPLSSTIPATAGFFLSSQESETTLVQAWVESRVDAPFNTPQVALGGLRATLTLPSYLDPALVELTLYIKAQRNRSSPGEPIPTLMVKGAAGIAVQAAVMEVSQYLADTGVTSDTNAGIVVDLSTALTAIVAGDNQTAASELRDLRASLDQLVSTGELSRAEFRELWPRILQLAAGMRKPQ